MENQMMIQETNSKKKNQILIGVLVVLVSALVFETGYLIKLNKEKSDLVKIKQKDDISSFLRFPLSGFPNSPFNSLQWDPFAEMERMQEQINRMFHDSFRRGSRFDGITSPGWAGRFFEPTADIQDKGDFYLVKLDLPGMEKDRISIEATDNALTVSGERNVEEEKADKKHGYYRMERSFGQFQRMIPLPADVKSDEVTADYEKGVLTIKLPKITAEGDSQSTKSIPVK